MLLALIVASKGMSAPLELVSFSVMRLSTLILFISELSISLISSSNSMKTSVSTDTLVAKFAGLKATTGGVSP